MLRQNVLFKELWYRYSALDKKLYLKNKNKLLSDDVHNVT